jgi:hypothetical protein
VGVSQVINFLLCMSVGDEDIRGGFIRTRPSLAESEPVSDNLR